MNRHKKDFYPDYLFEVVLTIALALEALFVLSTLYPKGIGRVIDFTAPYQPKPEWYFLWLYQLVRYFHGPFIFVGTVVLPFLAVMVLLLIPWIDRKLSPKVSVGAGIGLFIGFVVLTILAYIG
ncbi:MAG: hypothetical protein D6778_03290 [Nitrospirae bacterium]|nr:MAG: hypothetical protein D6778_03290 [Nitrospirota bacterium]